MNRVITWVDLQGRYRVTSPAYNDATRPPGETEDDTIQRVVIRLRARYGLPAAHPFTFVDDADQRARVQELGGNTFRYDAKTGSALTGAWEMDADGRPRVNMATARTMHRDRIAVEAEKELVREDKEFQRASDENDTTGRTASIGRRRVLRGLAIAFDLSTATTPAELDALWPPELPAR